MISPPGGGKGVTVLTYQVGDMISHPLHGAGVIADIEIQKIGGEEREYYVLKLPTSEMQVKIPKATSDIIGVRPIISPEEAERVMLEIPNIEINMTQNWNKRYRENMVKIKSGDLLEVASVIKGLFMRDREKGLSTGERKMLHSAKQILISEIVLSMNASYDEIEARIELAMG